MYGIVLPTIRSASHASSASSDGMVPTSAIDPVVYGLSSGTQSFPSWALMIGAARRSAASSSSGPAPRAPAPARIAILVFPSKTLAASSSNLRSGSRIGGWYVTVL